MSSKITPLVGIVSCRRIQDRHYFHMVGEKYISAVNDYADCAGVLIPAVKDELLNESILDKLDGFLLTGSLSNVHPDRYNVEVIDEELIVDESRDGFVFSMIDVILEREIPLFAICRGFQEMNVAFGGTLYQDLDRDSSYKDHDFKRDDPQEIQYGVSHKVSFVSNGLLNQITGVESAEVNSLHAQGVQELGDGLTVDAVSDDGLVEAFTVDGAQGFNLSVQWHPEWKPGTSSTSTALFNYFGNACKVFAEKP